MKGLFSLLSIVGLVLCFGSLSAQGKNEGNITIHSDARLAVLLKKTYSYVPPTRPEAPKPEVKPTPRDPYNTYLGPTGIVHKDLTKSEYTGNGFRVQIYNGPNREKAIKIKTDFMRSHPGVRTYITYQAPGFRVKIGDYRHRADAEGMLREANSISESPSMIVPDVVTISDR